MKIKPLFLIPFIAITACEEADEQTEKDGDDLIESVDTLTDTTESIVEIIDSTLLPQRMQDEANMILGSVDGDLDKDGVAEKVVVYARDLEWESSAPRDLVIYKQKDGVWEEWIATENAILRADEGGMMGDPFYGDLVINKGVLAISHSGGSSWKWGHTDKYRYQDGDFYLIGFSSSYGKPCEYWQDVDYNLSTGDCVFKFEPEKCEEANSGEEYGDFREEKFNHKMKDLPKLTKRRSLDYSFKSPKGEDVYL